MAALRGTLARALAYLSVLGTAVSARADAPRDVVRTGRDALPAVDQVLLPARASESVTAAATLGYGVTESQAGEGAHHRLEGTLATSVPIAAELALALAVDARYDVHPQANDAAASVPRVRLVYAHDALPGLQLGAAATFQTGPSFRFDAPVLTALLLGAYELGPWLTISAQAGFRLDESGAIGVPERASLSMHLTRAASDWHALPLGVSARTRLGTCELAAELGADVLLGAGAPGFGSSPLRAAFVGRLALARAVTAELLLRFGLSARPTSFSQWTPVEPRFVLGLGVRMAFEPAPVAPVVVAPARSELRGEVRDREELPLAAATVTLRQGSSVQTVQTAPDGSFVLRDLARGAAQLEITADGFVPEQRPVQLDGPRVNVEVHVERRALAAQLRGLVRSFEGAPLPASVRVSDPAASVSADNDGRFVLELPPGVYQIEIECAGYLTQRRKVRVQENGVTVLNVELRAGQR